MSSDNGGIIGVVNDPTDTVASGVWQQEEQYEAKVNGTWPQRALFTTNSARFNSGSSDYLSTTTGTATNTDKCTISFWVKRGFKASGDGDHKIIANYTDANNRCFIFITGDNQFQIFQKLGGSTTISLKTNRLFRDFSAWYHIVVAVDTTQGTDTNRIKLYINGVQETSFATATYPSQNENFRINESSVSLNIGRPGTDTEYLNGYLSEVILIDGQQLAPTSFGVSNSDGVWTPIPYTGTFGTNGFNLQFENAAALGEDSSSNGNNFTVNNLTSIDQSTDYPEVNFATLNPLNQISSVAYSEGNLKFTNSSSTNRLAFANFAMTSGKFYCEMKVVTLGANYTHIGLRNIGSYTLTNAYVNDPTNEKVSYLNDGRVFISGAETSSMPTYTSGDIVGMACDMDNGYLYYHKNGTYINSGNPASGGSGSGGFDIYNHGNVDYCFAVSNSDGGTDPVIDANFGSPPYSISSGNADGNGYGNFEYAVPSGYYALNTKNLAEFG
jgi:hypothetical protein